MADDLDNLKLQLENLKRKWNGFTHAEKLSQQVYLESLRTRIKAFEVKPPAKPQKETQKEVDRMAMAEEVRSCTTTPDGFACAYSHGGAVPGACTQVTTDIFSACRSKSTIMNDGFTIGNPKNGVNNKNVAYLLGAINEPVIKNTCITNFSVDAARFQFLKGDNHKKLIFSKNIVYDSIMSYARKQGVTHTKLIDGTSKKASKSGISKLKGYINKKMPIVTIEDLVIDGNESAIYEKYRKLERVLNDYKILKNKIVDLRKNKALSFKEKIPQLISFDNNLKETNQGLVDKIKLENWGKYRFNQKDKTAKAQLEAFKSYYYKKTSNLSQKLKVVEKKQEKSVQFLQKNKAKYDHIVNKQLAFHAGHRDALQLVPNDEMLLGRLDNVTIKYNIFYSRHKMQGPFSSDGAFKNLNIQCNIYDMNVDDQGRSAFNGMLSGSFVGNYDQYRKEFFSPRLRPARLGAGTNVWVIGFHSKSEAQGWKYDDIAGIEDKEKNDQRKMPVGTDNPKDLNLNLKNFNVSTFKAQVVQVKSELGKLASVGSDQIPPVYIIQYLALSSKNILGLRKFMALQKGNKRKILGDRLLALGKDMTGGQFVSRKIATHAPKPK